ncbi:MAG: aminoacetone oxidase family FAD-binding enzyme [Planctomycetota bacterium]
MAADVIILGAGAAGMLCAATAAGRGRRVVVIDHADRPGRKLLITGGGRCNFANRNEGADHYLSANPRFAVSALRRFPTADIVAMFERYGIPHSADATGCLFGPERGGALIAGALEAECRKSGVEFRLSTPVKGVVHAAGQFTVRAGAEQITAPSLVVATGGPAWPQCGATGIGYDIARQFGLAVIPPRPGLVPLVYRPDDRRRFRDLAGITVAVEVACGAHRFRGPLLFTHEGLSGPAGLNAGSCLEPGMTITIDLIPGVDLATHLAAFRAEQPRAALLTALIRLLPRRIAQSLTGLEGDGPTVSETGRTAVAAVRRALKEWSVFPEGTAGYASAEVTMGGVDTAAVSSRTFEVSSVPGLHFIGEVLDVTGHLGGYNLMWAWASGHCAGMHL